MKLAMYRGGGVIAIEDAPIPACPEGGLLVQVMASALCSGELMAWYMDQKAPHVLGHEFSGTVIESESPDFPVGCRVAPHHHAPCMECDLCRAGHTVHCPTWKKTKLNPGGLAEFVAISRELLTDCHRVEDVDPRDAALVEPLACVMKSLRRARWSAGDRTAVIGLGVMGLMHALMCPGCTAVDLNPSRIEWAKGIGINAQPSATEGAFDVIFVCPGSDAALEAGLRLAAPGARVVLFAPTEPGHKTSLDLNQLYFRDIELITCYSCGPADTTEAIQALRAGKVKASQVVSHFISMDELPMRYLEMKAGTILKPMVEFSNVVRT